MVRLAMDRWRRKLRSLYSYSFDDGDSPQDAEPGPSEGSSAVTTNSPVNKRRGFSGRKWLPPPLRKLSGGKVEKNATPDRTPLKKTPSDKRLKSPASEMGNKQGLATTAAGVEEETSRDQNGEEGEEEVELPPPMKPINEPILVPSDDSQGQRSSTLSHEGATSADLAEIEQIVKERMEQHNEKQSKLSVSDTAEGEEEGALQKREYVIRELVETERDYVRDLRLVVEGYIALMRDPDCDIPMPEDLRSGKDKMVFGNMEAIYEWHRDVFLKALERCNQHPEELGQLFKKYERKLHMYVVYCQNKPVSEYIVSEHIDTYFEELRQKLGHKLQLCDLLIKPVQRIMKYQLLLRDVYKYTERAHLSAEMETLRSAIHIMQVVPKEANDMMDIGRLQGFDGKITAQGKLLLHGPLVCCEGTSAANFKGKELQVFLFEQNIIFSEAVGKKTQFTNPVYIYKNHIQVNKMSFDEKVGGREREEKDSGGVDLFCVRSTDPRKPSLAYVCQAQSCESRSEWLHTFRNILQSQKNFLIAIQSPIAYQKELTKDPFTQSSPFHPPSPPIQEECPMIVSEPISTKTKHQSNFLEGFRNSLRRAKSEAPEVESGFGHVRRWSDAHSTENEGDLVRIVGRQSVLVPVSGAGAVECCDHETGTWRAVASLHSAHGHVVPGLSEGHTYSFRLSGSNPLPLPLPAITIPYESRWQQEQFERRYQELRTIGRGRTAVVTLAQDRGTAQRVALKCVDRRRIPQLVTRAEYGLLTSLNHPNIVKAMAIFENAPRLGVDTIVMELLQGMDVLTHACSLSSVSEAYVRTVTLQLLSALDYLQLQLIIHCDIKPENLLVEECNNQFQLKIVDFGSAFSLNTKEHQAPVLHKPHLRWDLEFAAPELLCEPASPCLSTDMWSCAVLIYVFLSGVSPFLDDSPEETTAHILNIDFSFPPGLFPAESERAQEFVSSLLLRDHTLRPLAHTALSVPWLKEVTSNFDVSPTQLASFVNRRNPHAVVQNIVL